MNNNSYLSLDLETLLIFTLQLFTVLQDYLVCYVKSRSLLFSILSCPYIAQSSFKQVLLICATSDSFLVNLLMLLLVFINSYSYFMLIPWVWTYQLNLIDLCIMSLWYDYQDIQIHNYWSGSIIHVTALGCKVKLVWVINGMATAWVTQWYDCKVKVRALPLRLGTNWWVN